MIKEERIFKKWFEEGAFGKYYEDLTDEDKQNLSETLSYSTYQAGVLLNEAMQKLVDALNRVLPLNRFK